MSTHHATISWERHGEFARKRFHRGHRWSFDGGVTVPAGASPLVVPAQWTDVNGVDPEEAFVAAIASCHMQSFLFHAANDGFVVESYVDTAEGTLTDGWISEVRLKPAIVFSGHEPSEIELQSLHDRAHESCFIAKSVKTKISVEP